MESNEKSEKITPIIVNPLESDDSKKKRKTFISLKKYRLKRKETEPKKKKARVLHQTKDILPFLSYDEQNNVIVTKTGYMDILQIKSRDIYSFNEDEVQRNIYEYTKFLRTYIPDIKEVALSFPVNTTEQQQYIQRKIDKTNNPIFLKYLHQKHFELQLLEKHRTNLEYFLFIYARDLTSIIERRKTVIRLAKHSLGVSMITENKKCDIIFKMNNQNSKIL
ncbi:hypothetical protein NSQ59_27685 [Margalitia sp. FSL K6-0131]|uniref:hypothetical protein n=1 Tax=Margalitia sp. FSL K6-0131 TaxID=2954604 RepID=UPI0030F5C33C